MCGDFGSTISTADYAANANCSKACWDNQVAVATAGDDRTVRVWSVAEVKVEGV